MRPHWDRGSDELRGNLEAAYAAARRSAVAREPPTPDLVRGWHRTAMRGLAVPDPAYAGRFRGEPGVAINVRVGPNFGAASGDVEAEVAALIAGLARRVGPLDARIRGEADVEDLQHIVPVCAWVHAEWVRIHPFVNGNGRTARLWANWVAMRYGLPGFVRLRPRPGDDGYAHAAAEAMLGNWHPTVAVMFDLFLDYVRSRRRAT